MKKFLSARSLATWIGLCAVTLSGCAGAVKPDAKAAPDADATVTPQFATRIEGAPAESTATEESVEMRFAVVGGDPAQLGLTVAGFECRVGEGSDYRPCDETFVISGLQDGHDYVLSVRAILTSTGPSGEPINLYAQEATISFKVALATARGTTRVGALSSKLQVGAAYRVDVPEGQHVTEYSTSKTTGVLSVFRIFADSDPYYLGNFRCENDWDRVVASVNPAGESLLYCHSTPTRVAYKAMNEWRLANNHIEIATDTDAVTETNHERLSVSIYDEDYELMTSRSRFVNVCLNSERHFIDVPLVNDFFLAKTPETALLWYCDTYLPGMSGEPELWRVGAFYDVDGIDWSCEDCKWTRAVEMVYMARANSAIFTPADFAKQVQHRMLELVTKVTP